MKAAERRAGNERIGSRREKSRIDDVETVDVLRRLDIRDHLRRVDLASRHLHNAVRINPNDLMKEYGADILRLWALSVDFTEDHRIGKEILAGVADQYRKLRNTFRYLLGALDGFSDEERLEDVSQYRELDRYMLHVASELDKQLRRAVERRGL